MERWRRETGRHREEDTERKTQRGRQRKEDKERKTREEDKESNTKESIKGMEKERKEI